MSPSHNGFKSDDGEFVPSGATQAAGHIQTTTGRDQAASDGDQMASNSDQAASDGDQTASDRDQLASDRESLAGADQQAHDQSKEDRESATQLRHEQAHVRAGAAEAREANADERDRLAAERDRLATARDAADEKYEHVTDAAGLKASQVVKAQWAKDRRRAAAHRAGAAGDRRRAAADRARAAIERADAAREQAEQVHEISERRREQAEKAVRGLEATRDVVFAIGGEIALERVLGLIVERGRLLVAARSVVIMLRDGEELVVQASAGHVHEARGVRVPIADSTSGQVLEHLQPERVTDVAAGLRIDPAAFGVPGAQTALFVPMVYRGEAMGVLAAFDRDGNGNVFSEDDEQVLRTFAASAATAVVLAQSVQADRLRSSLAAADAERRHWARELHDETLQSLGALRIRLSSALRRDDLSHAQEAMREAVAHLEREIENLRSIITDLRSAALDELGLRVAIETLLDRHRARSGLEVDGEITIVGLAAGRERLEEELETAVYRVVQEALTNVTKHANAEQVRVAVSEADGEILVEVQDDGTGFDPETASHGFGLAGMQERVSLAGGTLSVDSGERGTVLSARLPVHRRDTAGRSRKHAKGRHNLLR